MKKIEVIVKDIFTELFSNNNIEQININSEPSWDSMKQLTIITAIESEFDIFIDADDAMSLTSFSSIIEFLKNHPEID